jgi:ABC-type branched-subunit amino acid transport system permease subunit
MQTALLYLTLGLGGGALFACLGLSASITHRGSGVVNLAIGTMAMVPALTYHSLRVEGDLVVPVVGLPSRLHLADRLPVVIALPLALAVGVGLFVLAVLVVFHPMRDAPAVTKAVASIGVSLVLLGVAREVYGARTRQTTALLPDHPVHLFGGQIPADRLWFVVLAVGFTVVCTAFFRWSRAGLVLRAGSDNERGVLLLGWSPRRSAVVAWALAGLVASGAAVVLASFASIAPAQFGLYTVPALGAALAGRFRNLWVVCGVGLGIGALQGLAVHLGALESLPRTLQGGFDDALPLLVIVVALSFAGTTLPKRGALAQRSFPTAAPAPRPSVFGAVVVVALAVGWFGASPLRLSLVETTITAVLALSMVVSAGYIGQVSLAQVTIAGLAAYLLAGLTSGLHVPFPVAPVLAVLGAGALGFVVGIPALRIRGAQLMVVSLAFAVAINRLVLQNGELGRSAFGLTIEPARLFGMDLGTFGPGRFPAPRSVVLIVGVAALSFVATANLRRSSTGRRWLAVRGNESAAAACGVDVVRAKLLASAVAVGLAGVAGVLVAQNVETLSYRLFDIDLALALVALAYLGGVASISGAVVAGLLTAGGLVEHFLGVGSGKQGGSLVYGVALVLVCVVAPGGLAGIADGLRKCLGRLARAGRTPDGPAADAVVGDRVADGIVP